MKGILIFLFFILIISLVSLGQEPVLEVIQEGGDFEYEAMFSELNPKKITTGILYDKNFLATDISRYTGRDSTAISDNDIWYDIYMDLRNGAVKEINFPPLSKVRQRETNNFLPILIMNIKYNKIKKNALEKVFANNSYIFEFMYFLFV